ncbi:ribonuclease P protein subunit p40 [Myxocyprinus asiaticus]|uniref:ribonuclease P protein subunit p40 n=1 Tax=Myxocyprinus asiaticus TaxID=70543 RepID=UPI0022216DBB|nr:ribonuclease P protein subunit p40 [Myxocyprinus asiaticus]
MSPEMEKCSRSLLVCEKSNFLNEKSRHDSHVSKHSFNCKISLLIPECAILPADISRVINNFSPYYLVRDLPVHELLQETFLETVIKKGNFYALSYNTKIDEDNTIALMSSGQLILSLDKDTYEQLGLEGRPSLYNHRKAMRYVVTLDLTDKTLVPGTKRYQRVLSSLKDRLPLKYDFLLTKHNTGAHDDTTIYQLLSQYTHVEHKPAFSSQTLKNLPCPTLYPSDLQGTTLSCNPHHFLEWLGAVNLDINCENAADSFLSSYVCPEPQSSVSQALLCTITGFISPEDVYVLLQELRKYFDEPKLTPWLSLTVHGFMDSPVSWGTTEHGFLKGGENFYNFVCFKNQDYWLHMATGAQDGCPP